MISSKRAEQIFWWPFFALTVSVEISPASSSICTLIATVDCGRPSRWLISLTLSRPVAAQQLQDADADRRRQPLEDVDVRFRIDGQEVGFHDSCDIPRPRRTRHSSYIRIAVIVQPSATAQPVR